MTICDFLRRNIPCDIQASSDFAQIMYSLSHFSYIELVLRKEKYNEPILHTTYNELIISTLIQNEIYLCFDFSDFQNYLILICHSSREESIQYLVKLVERYVNEKRIEELRFLSFVLYILSDFTYLYPVVKQIDKLLYNLRINAYMKIWKDELYTLSSNVKTLHQYNFIDLVFKYNNEAKTVKDLASLCGYSLTTFKSLFKNCFQISPYQWKMQQRKERIMCLIQYSTFSLFEISELCKFTAYSNFCSFCRTHLNDTPKKLLERFRNK